MEQRHDSWNAILATMPLPAIVLSHQLRVQTANQSFLETFHLSDEKTLNRNIFKVGNGQWNFPEVHRLLHYMLRDSGGRLQGIAIEHDFERIGHRAFQINACHLNVGPANLILFALHEIRPEHKYRSLFEAAGDGILIVDAESAQITDANQLVTDLLGYHREQLIGLRFWEVDPLVGAPLGREGFERVRANGMVRFPVVSLQTKHGRSVETEVVGNIIQEGDNRSVQFNLRDITERRKSDLRSQNDARQESLRVLAGGIARDLNALLAVIMGNATVALSDAPRESPYRDALNTVMDASQRAAELTRQMLEYSCKGQLTDKALNSPFDLIFCDLVSAALKAGRQSGKRR